MEKTSHLKSRTFALLLLLSASACKQGSDNLKWKLPEGVNEWVENAFTPQTLDQKRVEQAATIPGLLIDHIKSRSQLLNGEMHPIDTSKAQGSDQ